MAIKSLSQSAQGQKSRPGNPFHPELPSYNRLVKRVSEGHYPDFLEVMLVLAEVSAYSGSGLCDGDRCSQAGK